MREKLNDLKNIPIYEPFLNVDHSDVADKYSAEFAEAKRIAFRGRSFTGAINRALREYAALALIKNEFDHASSGVVIAGFGKTQLFPAMFRMASQGIVLGVPKYLVHPPVIISRKETESTHISAFAQGEMVVRFMEGVDAAYSQYLSVGIRQLIQRVSDELIRSILLERRNRRNNEQGA